MNDEQLPPLDAEVAALLKTARAPVPSAALRARAFERIATSAAAAGAGGAAGAAAGAVKLGALAGPLIAAAAAVGGLAGYAIGVRQASPAPPPIVINIEAPRPTEPLTVPPVPASPPAERPAPAPRRDMQLADERALIEMARSALARHDTGAGMQALERHVATYPVGKLVEEREALMIRALVDAGRRDEAVERAARFRARFPSSLLLPVVEAMLE